MPKNEAPYITAMVAAQDALDLFDRHGHGRYLWQAWAHIRTMEREYPAHAEARAKHLPGGQLASGIPALQARLFAHLDGVFDDLQAIGEVTSGTGIGQLKAALRIDGKRGPTYAESAQRQQEIVHRVRGYYGWLISALQRMKEGTLTADWFNGGMPDIKAQSIYTAIAKKSGVTAHSVKTTWLAHLRTAEGEEARGLSDQARALHEEIRKARRKGARG